MSTYALDILHVIFSLISSVSVHWQVANSRQISLAAENPAQFWNIFDQRHRAKQFQIEFMIVKRDKWRWKTSKNANCTVGGKHFAPKFCIFVRFQFSCIVSSTKLLMSHEESFVLESRYAGKKAHKRTYIELQCYND